MPSQDSFIQDFKQLVIQSSQQTTFIHHPWFVEYHLRIVEQIAQELLAHYPQADADLVMVLVWLHDYGKTIDFDNQYETTLTKGREALQQIGFDATFTNRALEYAALIDKKLEIDLRQAPIEVQIVSSADGCSHLVGPFMDLWWWENPKKDFEELMAGNRRKALKDWNYKIVLPEARAAFVARHDFLLEQCGDLPDRFIPAPTEQ